MKSTQVGNRTPFAAALSFWMRAGVPHICVLLLLFSIDCSAFEIPCVVNNTSGYCAAPERGPWVCSGNTLNTGSSPECDTNHPNCDVDDQVRDLLAGKEADYYHACKYSSNWSDDYFYTRYT